MSKEFHGKYRGIVTDIRDPLMQGRIKAKVPEVYGNNESGWALPCLAFGGSQMGFFVLPDIDSAVWIEFEHSDPGYPIWVGSLFASSADMPAQLMSPPYTKTMIMSKTGHSITLDDSPGVGGILLQTAGGQKISMTSSGIEIDNGYGAIIVLSGNQISFNNGALEVI